MNGNTQTDLNKKEEQQDSCKTKKKRKLSQLEKDIIKLNYLSNLKIKKKYNCTKKTYDKNVISILLNNAYCHLVSVFKERMLTDYVEEFLRRQYSIQESTERIPKFSIYYKNYLLFFCQPTFTNCAINEIINDYGERRAEVYYKNNYQGGKSNENEDNMGFEESDSEEESSKTQIKFNENGEIFNNSIKENIDNVTIMTTINNSKNNTINLNLNNEKIEVFSENKCDKSNDTTLHDLMDIVKKGQQKTIKKSINNNKLNIDVNTDTNNCDNNTYSNSNNFTNTNKSKKSTKVNKKKNDIFNIIDYKRSMLNRGVIGRSQSKKKDGNKLIKKHIDKNNNNNNNNIKSNKIKNKFSLEKLQKLFKKGKNINDFNNMKRNVKFPINNFINIINDKNNQEIKIKGKENKEKEKENKENEKKEKERERKDSSNQKKNKNISVNKKYSNHSVNSKNKSVSKEKDQDKRIIKINTNNNNNNNNNNRFYSIKNSYGNISNNLLQNNLYKNNTNNNYNIYMGGSGTNKNSSKSRNNTGFLYKQQNTHNIINNNIMYNVNNIYNTTSLHNLYRNLNNNIHNNGYSGKINPFKTLNFLQTTNHHQRYNNNYIQNQNDNNKCFITNTSQDNKSSSLKILVTELNNQNRVKPTIKLQNEKDLIKSKYNNNKENNLIDTNTHKNHRNTKSYNNLNLNNIHFTGGGITSYNNMKIKNKKYYNNSRISSQLRNIKGNQINSNSSNKNKKTDANNKELMQLALSLLIDNNSSTFNNIVGNNNNNANNFNNNNTLVKTNVNSRNSTKKNYAKKSKSNNFKNKYHNNNTNYNININNQININTNSNSNNAYNIIKNGKDYLNTKIRNQIKNKESINNNIKDIYSNNFLNTNSNLHMSGYNGINNHNHYSENINLTKKFRTRNINSSLKKGKFYININKTKGNTKNEENVIKSYHTKSVSSLTDLINHNRKVIGSYKNISKSKSKEHKYNY